VSTSDGADQLVELDLHRGAIPVLSVLDEKDHQEGHDGRTGVDHQLPTIAEAEDRAGDSPDHNDRNRHPEGAGMPCGSSGPLGETVERVCNTHR
jgi:hypothetical protein